MLSQREIDRIVNLDLSKLGLDSSDKIMLESAVRELSKAFAANNENAFAEAYRIFEQRVELCGKKTEIAALLGNGEYIPDDVYDVFLATGAIDNQYLDVIADNVSHNRPLKSREQMIYNARKAEIDDLVAKSNKTTTATKTTLPFGEPSKGIKNDGKTGRKIDYATVDRSAFLRQAREAENNPFDAHGNINIAGSKSQLCLGNCAGVTLIGSAKLEVKGVIYGDISIAGSAKLTSDGFKGSKAVISGSGKVHLSRILDNCRLVASGSSYLYCGNNYNTMSIDISGSCNTTVGTNYGKIALNKKGSSKFWFNCNLGVAFF